MDMKFGLLCDAANVTNEGKLNILGEFNRIWSTSPPVRWPLCWLVARFEAHITEGTDHALEVDLINEDGRSLMEERPSGALKFQPTGPGRPLRAQVMMRMQDIQFPEFGDYEFHFLVDGTHVGSVPIYIMERDESAPGS